MFWKRKTPRRRLTLRGKVLAVLLPGLITIIGVELWLTRLDAIEAANAAFDRSLLGAIKSVDLGVSTDSGGLAVELPYRLFEFFQLTARGNVYFRVATADGLVEIGSPDLPQPDEAAKPGVPVFHDAMYFGEPVRVGSYVRPLEKPLSPGGVQQLVIQVAEGAESRRAFSRSFVLRSAARDALVVSLIGITLAIVLTLLLRPVSRLAAQLRQRQPTDLRPIDAQGLPRDIQPLVDAVNQQLARTQGLMQRQRHFLDDASHQLRTPLATLHAQVGYALRQQDPLEVAAALASIAEQLEHATRTTNQLLTLARTDAVALNRERFDLGEMVRDVATRLLPLARARQQDFGVDLPAQPCPCDGDRGLLAEALSNLGHNAIVYGEAGGQVTLSARCDDSGCHLSVVNTGPPIPEAVVLQLGQRFLKGPGSRGAGLGLAIVKSIIEQHGGSISLERQTEPAGPPVNCAVLWWPRGNT